MTAAPKMGRPKSPCKKCGGNKRDVYGNCIPCTRDYRKEYRKKWVADRKEKMKPKQKKEKP